MQLSKRMLQRAVPADPKTLKPVMAADIETEGLRGPFKLGALYPENGGISMFATPEAMLAFFLQDRYKGWEMLLHNAEYDVYYLLPGLVELTKQGGWTVDVVVNGEMKIIHLTIHNGTRAWYIRDTYALMPLALADLGALARLPKLALDFEQGVLFDPEYEEHRRYLERDCMITLYAYKMWAATLIKHFEVLPGWTSGATALKAFRRTIPEGVVYMRQRAEVEAAARAAYFGGQVYFPKKRRYNGVVKIDMNAAFAHAMRAGVPVKAGAYTDIEIEGYPALYRAWVEPPKEPRFPLVPMRGEDKETKYPRAGYETWLTSNILQYARTQGYTIRVVEGYIFEALEYPFNAFLDRCEELERKYRRDGTAVVIKHLRNPLYGKFGQRPDSTEYYLTGAPEEDMTPLHSLTGERIENLYFRPVERQAGNIQPLWAAWITAQARVNLHQAAQAIGEKYCYYADTDSLIVDQNALDYAIMEEKIPIGPAYGEWKIEREYAYFYPFNPKTYLGITAEGEYDARHKGIPTDAVSLEQLLQLAAGSITEIVAKFVSMGRAIKHIGTDSRSDVTRTINPQEGTNE